MKCLLASFCNIPYPTTSPVLLITLPLGKESRIIPISLGKSVLATTATGITRGDGKVFVSYISDGKYMLAVLRERDLSLIYEYKFPASQDVHSMLYDKGHLYVISTGTDKLLKYKVTKIGLEDQEIIWEADKDGKENHHINSIFKFGNDLIVSGFGKSKMDNVWRTSYDGLVFNVSKKMIMKDGIYHPHSVSSNGKELFYCESGYGRLCSLSKTIQRFDGYTRGLQFDGGNVYLATSIGRMRDNDGRIYNPADSGKKKGKCRVYSFTENSILKTNNYIDFEWFANEIYDLLVVDVDENLDKVFLNSFLNERNALYETLAEQSRFWNYMKRKLR